jgi:two-component system, LuxR family, response regulator FixJ
MPQFFDTQVYIVDDDPACRDSLGLLLELSGIQSITCESAEDFLNKAHPEHSGCMLLDYRMPGMSGLELQAEMKRRELDIPIIMLSAHGDVATTRNVMKAGAVDFLEKPIDPDQLMESVITALQLARAQNLKKFQRDDLTKRLQRLTKREVEVLRLVLLGSHNREIAVRLSISARTVEVYKSRLMIKLEVSRIAQLIRLFAATQLEPP